MRRGLSVALVLASLPLPAMAGGEGRSAVRSCLLGAVIVSRRWCHSVQETR